MTKSYLMTNLVEKMQSSDQDYRYMGLNDLSTEIRQDPSVFQGDESVENRVLDQVLFLVEDKISEVKNQAVKCLGQLIKILRQTQMEVVVDKLIDFSSGKDEELRDISTLEALKTITAELPPDGKIAQSACGKLTPKLLGQLANVRGHCLTLLEIAIYAEILQPSAPPETLVEILAILSILISRFPVHVSNSSLDPQPLTVLAPLLNHQRPVVRKRAILTLSQFIPISQLTLFENLLQTYILPNLSQSVSIDKQRTMVQLVAAITRQSSHHISPVLGEIIPSILEGVQRDDEELREGALQALEALALRLPAEITSYLTEIVQAGLQLMKFDPNYTVDDDEDEGMADADDDGDEGDDLDDEYSDDEDTSYKIRRSATKLLASVITTRPELLVSTYKEISPVLISRFGDREETVRLEIWHTYTSLLKQTAIYGGRPEDDATPRGKRKRDADEIPDSEETPYTLLKSQVPSLSKALLNQLKSPKTPPVVLQTGFGLLKALLVVLPGSLSPQVQPVTFISTSILSQPPSTSTSTLHLMTLSFLSLFFSTHAPSMYSNALPLLIPVLQKSLGDRHPRVASESFRVFSSLLRSLKPLEAEGWVDQLYDQAVQRLASHDTDAEVRTSAEECIADLWVCATDIVRNKGRKEWEYICRSFGKTDSAVNVVRKVAKEVQVGDDWVNGIVEWLINLLKKSGRLGKAEVFSALDVLLRSYTSGVPNDLPLRLIPQVKGYLSTADFSLLSQSLNIIALLLETSPASTFPEVERDLLPDLYVIAHSPLISGAALESLFGFFAVLVQADNQIAPHIILNLVTAVEKASNADASSANVARCIAATVKSQQGVAAGVIAGYSKHFQNIFAVKPSLLILSLLIMGELGRFIDMSPQSDIFLNVIELFSSAQEEIRAAAAFAAGNMAIGNLPRFLPSIIQLVESDSRKRLLALHASKEVVTHCSQGQLEGVADMLWVPLFKNSENAEETTRNVAAACLGKLATTHPSRYLPQLHARIRDDNASARATVISAIRYTFADTSQTYDNLLAPLIVDFLALIQDDDLTVRRLALSAMNSAARTKPHLIREPLPEMLPSLYKEAKVNPALVRTVQMGPWTHKVDDGLDTRKIAYETLYTLLDTCLTKLDLHQFISRIIPGLSDDSDEIKVICHMIFFRLSQVAPSPTAQHLDDALPQLQKTMRGATVTKDTVKQDLERAAEVQRVSTRLISQLHKTCSGISPRFDSFVDELKTLQWSDAFIGH